MSRTIRLAVVPGDGIGQEVVAEGLKVLGAVLPADVKLETTEFDLGARRYHRTGETLPDDVLAELKSYDAILLGAIGDPSVPSGVLERGLLLKLRFAFDHHINLRPGRLFPGVQSPLAGEPEIDFVVVREGTEGPYVGNGGTLRTGTPQEVATEVSLNTAYGIERVVRDAYRRAQARPRKKLTLVHKNNVLVHAGHLWTRIFAEVGKEFPEVTTDYLHVDAATIFFVTQPERFDVIVTDNLFGDILTCLLYTSGQGRPDRHRAVGRHAAGAPRPRRRGRQGRDRRRGGPGRALRHPQHRPGRRRARRPSIRVAGRIRKAGSG